ncbi:hypothetical protein B0J13DRAFT_597520 [Dactylonectria estremocensis]|uniref:Xylanolytic transcriptional activator regulatory domain-containing protein n=1 Tax=Dactylonectria estremocensis TaxID=1079267 RepID=A0A9P9EBH0_9HYPO|nr:hypothetical protein B0J13DRAFT_597520 [Dactylonectria estremocensis]
MPFLEVRGKPLFTARDGPKGATTKFIYIHGLGSSHCFYTPLMDQLANKGYSSVAFDTIGSGLSELKPDHEPTSIHSIAQDVENIIQQTGARPEEVIVIGHSMGAIVVSELAVKLKLKGAILIGPVLPKPALAEIFSKRIETVKKSGMEAMASTIPGAATGSKSTTTQKAFIRSLLLSQKPEGYNSLCRAIAEAGRPSYSSAKCPLLIIAGGEDKTSPVADAQVIFSEWGSKDEDKSLQVLEGVGHWHCIEASDEQRCDGTRPCRRCVKRGLGRDCQSSTTRFPLLASSLPSPDPDFLLGHVPIAPTPTAPGGGYDLAPRGGGPSPAHNVVDTAFTSPAAPPSEATSTSSQLLAKVPQMSRLVKTKAQYMFVGDSATLSFLQNIRRIVRKCLGSCPFVDDPLRHLIVESSPDTRRGWIMSSAQNPPKKQTPEDAQYLQRWYMQSANCVLLLFDQDELQRDMDAWQKDAASPVYYLVLAIGAQTGPEDKDTLAEEFFNYGRYLTVETLMEDPDIPTIQAFALITMYLLGASRRNSAFMYLGLGVRAAYSLGLHRKDVSALFPPAECRVRERLWKAIRILDLFMSASLGRPPSTSETRDTAAKEDYSAWNDLSMIFETVLSDIYAKRMISTEVIEKITQHHRRWAAESQRGFGVDGIKPGDLIENSDGTNQPNMGLLHLKQTAYWTIILVSLPFLLKDVSAHVDSNPNPILTAQQKPGASSSNQVLVYSCLEAAIQTVDLLQTVLTAELIPKRLPFLINSVFVSGLVLGVALFGDFDTSFPLERSLRLAKNILHRFAVHDPVAKRHLLILEHMQAACDMYVEMRARWKMERQSNLVGGLFGSIHNIGVAREATGDQELMQVEDNTATSPRTIPRSSAPGGQTPGVDLGPGVGDDLTNGFSDLIPAISPSLLWFDTFGETMPLYPTVDAVIGQKFPYAPPFRTAGYKLLRNGV